MHAPRIGRRFSALTEVQQAGSDLLCRFRRRVTLIVRRPLETDEDPVLAMLAAAPVDDEPVTDDDKWHIEEGRRAYRDGQVLSAEEVRRACLDPRGNESRRAEDPAVAV